MDLYDIHTHDVPQSSSDEEESKLNRFFILNVYPLGFEYAKDSIHCPWFSCGIHPWYSEDAEPQIKFLKEIAGNPSIIAIGEAGYDKLKGPDLAIQRIVFEQEIALSEQLRKPLIIHCVKAWDELLASHKKLRPKQPWIIHGYRGKPELTKQLLNHGFYLSINDRFNLDSLRTIPLDRLFCETDTQDITIREVYQKIADALQIEIEYLSTQLAENVRRVFSIGTTIEN